MMNICLLKIKSMKTEAYFFTYDLCDKHIKYGSGECLTIFLVRITGKL